MQIVEVRAKKWGNSLGLLIPKDVAEKEKIKENQKLDIIIIPKTRTLEKTFGMVKVWKKPAQQIKDEIRRELHDG
ncbi:MAG: AbrB/MazE/SpoVT family DNA-binding domain-containing protein [Candidatus Aenigmarchaeota archaeon]|nr:AbrB/MazE/SpoVT family DNA-binding domain-containing protein [Candidatus Aenigmarchaeota archaeon]